MPKWATPDRQLHLAQVLLDYLDDLAGWKVDLATGEIYHPNLEAKLNTIIANWVAEDRARRQAEWEAERKALHSLAERRYPLRGQFSTISKDIFYAEQPQFYIDGIGISGLTFRPFAKIRMASSYMRLHIDLSDSLKNTSKNARRKALRYGRLTDSARERIKLAVRHYLDNF